MILRAGIVLALLATSAWSDDPVEDDLNARVVAFARANLGERVGNGSCSSLVQAAMREAGAYVLKEPGPGGEYTWGTPVKSFKDARPGDVVQFENATFKSRRQVVREDGSMALVLSTVSFPHHSAIVAAVGPRGKTLTILHQNVSHPDGTKTQVVEEATITPSELRKGGSMKLYRPTAP